MCFFLQNILFVVGFVIMNDKEIKEILGYRIVCLRAHLQLNQSTFAKEIGCSQKYVSDWENGHKLITFRYVLEIIHAYNIPISYFNPFTPDFAHHLNSLSPINNRTAYQHKGSGTDTDTP